jgi:hypothetical protein
VGHGIYKPFSSRLLRRRRFNSAHSYQYLCVNFGPVALQSNVYFRQRKLPVEFDWAIPDQMLDSDRADYVN